MSSDDPSTSVPTVIGLLPIPIDRSYGLTLHLPITNQDYLLTHPDIPMYRDVDHAIQRLTKSSHAPAGTARAFHNLPFSGSNAIYTIRLAFNEFMKKTCEADLATLHRITLGRMEKSYYGGREQWRGPNLESCITLLDTPLVTSSDFFNPSTLSSFKTLSVLSDHVHKALLDRFPTLEAGEPGIFGCPTIRLTPLCKNGLPKRRPGATIAAKREAHLLARGSAIAYEMCEKFIGTIEELIKPRHFDGPHYQVYPFNFTPHLWLKSTKDRDLSRKSKKTWDDMAAELHSYIKSLNHSLTILLQWQPQPTKVQFGDLRSPLIFLRKHHRQAVLDALLPFDSHLATMLNYPTQGIPHKIDPRTDAERAATYRSLRTNLLRLRYAMTDGRFCALSSTHSVSAGDRRRLPPTPFSRESTPSSPVEEPQESFAHV